jgi:DNA-directed RNA polymerase specialized sigma24 family protein
LGQGFAEHVAANAVQKTAAVAEKYLADGRACQLRNRVAWLYRIAFRAAVRIAANDPPCVWPSPGLFETTPDPRSLDDRTGLLRSIVDEVLRSLSAQQRKAVECGVLGGLSMRQAAAEMGLTVGTYRKHLSRAMLRLRTFFEGHPDFLEIGFLRRALRL